MKMYIIINLIEKLYSVIASFGSLASLLTMASPYWGCKTISFYRIGFLTIC